MNFDVKIRFAFAGSMNWAAVLKIPLVFLFFFFSCVTTQTLKHSHFFVQLHDNVILYITFKGQTELQEGKVWLPKCGRGMLWRRPLEHMV